MTSNFTAIIVDDEPFAIELLSESLSVLKKKIEIIATFSSWNKALEGLQTMKADILFLDISVQGRNSMDLLKCIPGLDSEIIFITAHSDYTLEAFDFPVSGYVLKPFDDVRLSQALERAMARVRQRRAPSPAMVNRKIGIPDSKSVHYIEIDDIIYLEAFNTYTKVVTRGEELTCSYNIGKFVTLLPESKFFQVHRSFLINIDRVKRYEHAGIVVMDNSVEIPVSRNHREDLQKLFMRVKGDDPRR